LRLTIMMLLAAFCIRLAAAPRTGHAEEQSTPHALEAPARERCADKPAEGPRS
jgi:hypothetical protein